MSNNTMIQISGLDELVRDIERAASIAPKELQSGMKKIEKRFIRELKDEAQATYKSTENITSGFKMSPITNVGDTLTMKFMPEARGNKGHAWHLQEFGYDLTRPTWKSRQKIIRYSDGGEKLKYIQGKQLVNKILPSFQDYMETEAKRLVDEILGDNNL